MLAYPCALPELATVGAFGNLFYFRENVADNG